MQIEVSEKTTRKIQELKALYPERRAALIPALYLLQDEFGSLDRKVMAAAAELLEIPLTQVLSTATFYTMLRKRPVGRYLVEICQNVSCYLRGSDKLVAEISRKLGIQPGETTEDGLFTLEMVECLASCGSGPAIQINGLFHENMTPEKLSALIDKLREEGE